MEINKARVEAMVASGFNISAASSPFLRDLHPNGMRPMDVDKLAKWQKLAYLDSYIHHINTAKGPHLYKQVEVQAAKDFVNGGRYVEGPLHRCERY